MKRKITIGQVVYISQKTHPFTIVLFPLLTHYYFQFRHNVSIMIFHIICKTVSRQDNLTTVKAQKAERDSIITSLSWAISWVFTWPDTRFTRPNTCPVSSPQMVQVVSMLEVPGNNRCMSVADRSEVPKQAALLVPTHQFSTEDHMPQTPGEPKESSVQSLS